MPLKKGWVFGAAGFFILLFFVILIAGYIWVTYNRLVKQDEAIKALWAQVETQLQRRSDLIPNLVEVVKGYAKHEKEIFENVALARAKLAGAKTVDEKIAAANELSGVLGRLLWQSATGVDLDQGERCALEPRFPAWLSPHRSRRWPISSQPSRP